MSSEPTAAQLLGPTDAVLLDFDGPVCSVFAGYPAASVAEEMRSTLEAVAETLPQQLAGGPDPLILLRWVSQHHPTLLPEAEATLDDAELRAMESARPTEGAHEAIRAIAAGGRPIAIVSNNSAVAIQRYVDIHQLAPYVHVIVGRPHGRPSDMKPEPGTLLLALAKIDTEASRSVFIGDSVTDIEAAHRAGVRSIGFAKHPRRGRELAVAGANVVIDNMFAVAAFVAGE